MKWRFTLLLAATMAAGAAGTENNDLECLLDGVAEISASARGGTLCVFGDGAFPFAALRSPQRRSGSSFASVAAAACRMGRGRVAAFGHAGFSEESTLKDGDTGRLVANAVAWAGGAEGEGGLAVGVREIPGLSGYLRNRGMDVHELDAGSWGEKLGTCKVLCIDPADFNPDADLEAIEKYVRGGGGLVAFGSARDWLQANSGKSLAGDYPGNRLLAPAGIVWAGGDSGRYSRRRRRGPESGSIAVDREPPRMLHAGAALKALQDHASGKSTLEESDLSMAGATLAGVFQSLPAEDRLILPELQRIRERMSGQCVPTGECALSEAKHPLERIFLRMEVEEAMRLPPEEVKAHPAAAEFPGGVPAGAERVEREIEIDTGAPGWHNQGIYGNARSPYWHGTGLYAAPGEIITVIVPESATAKGLHVRIGAHSDSLMRNDPWRRVPQVCRRFPIDRSATLAANAFGGLVYIESPFDLKMGKIKVSIAGAVEAPHYVLGKTALKEWRAKERRRPAPWGELESAKLVLTLPSEVLRTLEDPEDLMIFWDGIMDRYAELLGRPPERRRAERFVSDEQISAGYMHSGYPLMTMLDICPVMVDKERILSNGHHGIWGLFHEIGHNHQNADWTFGGTTEVTVNLFSLYVMEKVCGITKDPHPGVIQANREKSMKKYLADGAPFETWQRDPFLALAMYIQLKDAFGWEAFTRVFIEYRNLPDEERPRSDEEKRDQWLLRFSRTVGRNLSPFFQAWGVPTSEKARASIAGLPGWMPEGFPPKGT